MEKFLFTLCHAYILYKQTQVLLNPKIGELYVMNKYKYQVI
jgi:hypothetical protein